MGVPYVGLAVCWQGGMLVCRAIAFRKAIVVRKI
jgi:hypothetical protein